jgi:hypothetical protein
MDGEAPTSQRGHGLILARTHAWLARIPLRSGYIGAPRMADGRVNERPAKGGQDETMRGRWATLPLRREEIRGDPMSFNGRQVTTLKRVTHVHWPGGVWEWHRPAAVEVRDGATVRRIPIRDATRAATFAAMVIGFLVGASVLRASRARGRNER